MAICRYVIHVKIIQYISFSISPCVHGALTEYVDSRLIMALLQTHAVTGNIVPIRLTVWKLKKPNRWWGKAIHSGDDG